MMPRRQTARLRAACSDPARARLRRLPVARVLVKVRVKVPDADQETARASVPVRVLVPALKPGSVPIKARVRRLLLPVARVLATALVRAPALMAASVARPRRLRAARALEVAPVVGRAEVLDSVPVRAPAPMVASVARPRRLPAASVAAVPVKAPARMVDSAAPVTDLTS